MIVRHVYLHYVTEMTRDGMVVLITFIHMKKNTRLQPAFVISRSKDVKSQRHRWRVITRKLNYSGLQWRLLLREDNTIETRRSRRNHVPRWSQVGDSEINFTLTSSLNISTLEQDCGSNIATAISIATTIKISQFCIKPLILFYVIHVVDTDTEHKSTRDFRRIYRKHSCTIVIVQVY